MEKIKNIGSRISSTGRKQSWAEFLCPFCLKIVERLLGNGLKQQSCGCKLGTLISEKNILNKTGVKHGQRYTRLYRIWAGMKNRCSNINDTNYGGRGITICNEWLEFTPFRDWSLSHGYSENLQINRIDNDGNYEPTNCNFVSPSENCQNKRNNKLNIEIVNEIRFLHNTGEYTQKELGIKFSINQKYISDIINNKRWKKDESD